MWLGCLVWLDVTFLSLGGGVGGAEHCPPPSEQGQLHPLLQAAPDGCTLIAGGEATRHHLGPGLAHAPPG